jgi:hypothetical protein
LLLNVIALLGVGTPGLAGQQAIWRWWTARSHRAV